MATNTLSDMAPQLEVNDTNTMLAQILLELKVLNYILINLPLYLNKGASFTEEIGGIRAAITAGDINNPT